MPPEDRPLIVEAYAGSRYPERPRRLLWRGSWRRVAEVLRQEEQPDRRCFNVRVLPAEGQQDDDTRLRLCYDYANDSWSAEPIP